MASTHASQTPDPSSPMKEMLLLTDRTLFVVPAGMHLPVFPAGSTIVVEYEIVEGRNVLTHVPAIRA
jgi:hypothetical protein